MIVRPPRPFDALAAVAKLEIGEVVRSRWLLFACAVYALLAAVFLFVGLRESTVVGFTGSGRVLFSLMHVLVLVLPLLALTATGQIVAQARDGGTLELLLSCPIPRTSYLLAVTAVRYVALLGPFLVLTLGGALVSAVVFGEAVPWPFVVRSLALSASLLWAFVGLGMFVSTCVRHQAKALVALLLVWVAAVGLVDFGLLGVMLAHRLNPRAVFLLAGLNPVQAVRMALLSGTDADLSVLGPVGFFLTNRIGDRALFALGAVWPAIVGASAFAAALRRFCRTDVV